MNLPPWETHDRLCPNRRPTVAFPNSACSGCRAVVAARAEGYARGLIEGDHGGRREGYRSGYAAGKDAVMTASYAQAVAVGQRDEREAAAQRVIKQGVSIVAGRPPQEYIMLSLAVAAVRGEQT